MNGIKEKVRTMILRWHGHMHRMVENSEVRATVDMIVQKKTKRKTNKEMDGLRPKGHARTADHVGGCPGQNILQINNSGR